MITVDDLALAIENSINSYNEEMKLEHEEAFDLAQHVLNFFGYSNRIIDNVLEPEDRNAFYMLEDSGVLSTEREEITLYDGREWRIHYWLFRNDRIAELLQPKAVEEAPVKKDDKDATNEAENIYSELPSEAWIRHEGDEDEE
jgi:hypothetical protein